MKASIFKFAVIAAIVAVAMTAGYAFGAEPGDDPPPPPGTIIEVFDTGAECFGLDELPKVWGSCKVETDEYYTDTFKFVFTFRSGPPGTCDPIVREFEVPATLTDGKLHAAIGDQVDQVRYFNHHSYYTLRVEVFAWIVWPWPFDPSWESIGDDRKFIFCPVHPPDPPGQAALPVALPTLCCPLCAEPPGDDPPTLENGAELFDVGVVCNGEHPEEDPVPDEVLPIVYGSVRAATVSYTTLFRFDFTCCMFSPLWGMEVFEREIYVSATYDPEAMQCRAEIIREEFQEQYLWHHNSWYTFACAVYIQIDPGWPLEPTWVELDHVVEWPYCEEHGHPPRPPQ